MESYVAGTYAWDPQDGFMLEIREVADAGVTLEFIGLRGRSYTIVGTDDMKTWIPVRFRIAGAAVSSEVPFFQPASLQRVGAVVSGVSEGAPPRFFKLLVQ
jgi:hypothetical protein